MTQMLDSDTGTLGWACTVHCSWNPCDHDGEPARPEPMHCDEQPTREQAIRFARFQTGGARPIVVHRGSWADGGHSIASEACPCGTFLLPALVTS